MHWTGVSGKNLDHCSMALFHPLKFSKKGNITPICPNPLTCISQKCFFMALSWRTLKSIQGHDPLKNYANVK
jgi:hypothetical protein